MIKVMKIRLLVIIPVMMILIACSKIQLPTLIPTQTTLPTSTLPTPQVSTTNVPDPREVAQSYLDHWKVEEYSAMYALLTKVSQDAISEDAFTTRYKGVANEAALSSWDYEILSSLKNPDSGQVGYNVILHSILVGDIERQT